MRLFLVVIITIGGLITLSSCGNYTEVKRTGSPRGGGALGGDSKPELPLSFAMIKTQILEPHCISCHTGRHAAYENYGLVKATAPQMLDRMQSQNPTERMPKGAPALSLQLQALFAQWIEAGSPEFATAQEPDTDPGTGTDTPVSTTDKEISFLSIKNKILKPYNCTKCHSQYNNYLPVQAKLGSIVALVTSDQMPFPRRKGETPEPVTADLKDLLIQWVAQGAPEFTDSVNTPTTPQPMEPTWISIRDNVLGPKCILCHNSFGSRAPTAMGTYRDLRNWFQKSPKLFDFENPNKSHFIGSMIGRVDPDNDEFFFDPMPFNTTVDDVRQDIDSVSPENIKIIEQWIKNKLPFDREDTK